MCNNLSIQGQVRYNESILAFAVKCGQTDSAKVLIEHGANVHARDGLGRSVLLTACFYGNFDAAKMLIQHGADVNVKDKKHNRTVLHNIVCNQNVLNMLQFVCLDGARIDRGAIEDDRTGILVRIERSLRDGKETLYSREEARFMWNLAFFLAVRYRSIAFRVYYKIRSLITFRGIFMAFGFDLGKGRVWNKRFPGVSWSY